MSTKIFCPHCEYEFDDDETWHGEFTVGKIDYEDGGYSNVTCPNLDCKKDFTVITSYNINFYTECKDCCEEECMCEVSE